MKHLSMPCVVFKSALIVLISFALSANAFGQTYSPLFTVSRGAIEKEVRKQHEGTSGISGIQKDQTQVIEEEYGSAVSTMTTDDGVTPFDNRTDQSATIIPQGALSISDYFPLTPGAIWTYMKNGNPADTEVITIDKRVARVEGVSTSVMRFSETGYLMYYTNDAGGLRIHGLYYPSVNISGKNRSMKISFIPPIQIAYAEPSVGETIHSAGNAKAVVPGLGTTYIPYSADYTINGIETITVQAGAYDALRITSNMTISSDTMETDVQFYAKGIGEVKETYGDTVLELISTNLAIHDLAVTGVTAPKSVNLSSKAPSKTATVKVAIQNRSFLPETIDNAATLANLVSLDVYSLGACPNPVPVLVPTISGKPFPITLASKKTLAISYSVTFDCANDPLRTSTATGAHDDYRFTAGVNHSALDGRADTHGVDDVCPRNAATPYEIDPNPDGTIKDKGCGTKKKDGTYGGDILTDVIVR